LIFAIRVQLIAEVNSCGAENLLTVVYWPVIISRIQFSINCKLYGSMPGRLCNPI